MTPEQRTLQARLAAHTLHARTDSARTPPRPAERSSSGSSMWSIPTALSDAERQRRALQARRAYFTRLALKSARARRKNASS